MLNTGKVEITFTFVNPAEHIKLYHDGKECVPDKNNEFVYSREISFPNTLRFEMQGKDLKGSDCKVDEDGNVVWDRFIIISKVSVDGIRPNLDFIKRWGRIYPNTQLKDFRPSNQIVYSNYMGFNGVIELEFEGSNILEWLLRTHQYKEDYWQKNYDYE
jgi:hypothetical protein